MTQAPSSPETSPRAAKAAYGVAGSAGNRTSPASALRAKSLPIAGDVVFAQPWEAEAFAMVVELTLAGHFSWADWVDCFSKEVAATTALEAAGAVPNTCYEQWLNAAETLLIEKGITSKHQLQAKRFAIGAVGSTHAMK